MNNVQKRTKSKSMTKFQEHDMNNGLLNQVLMWHNGAVPLDSRKLEYLFLKVVMENA